MSHSDVAALRAYAESLDAFIELAAAACEPDQTQTAANFSKQNFQLLGALEKLRKSTMIAGCNAGEHAREMTTLLDACFQACAAFRPGTRGGMDPTLNHLLNLLGPHLSRLRDLETLAEAKIAGGGDALDYAGDKLTNTGKTGKVRRDKLTEARDKWIYAQAKKGDKTYRQIMLNLRKIAESKRWRALSSPQAVEQAVGRYIIRHDLDPLPPRIGR